MITDLLNYSRIGTRCKPFSRRLWGQSLDRTVANLQKAVEGTAVGHPRIAAEVQGDETQLVQLFQNLIANGVKFRGERPPEVNVSARRDGDMGLRRAR